MWSRLVILLVVMVFVVPSPTASQNSGDSPHQTLIYGLPYRMGEFSYWTADYYATKQWNQAVYMGLYDRQSLLNGAYGPELAASMPSITPDGLTFIVDLKSGLKFDNGNPITADDVVFSYQVGLTPLINLNSYDYLVPWFASNSSILAVDEDTISFTFVDTYAFVMSLLETPIIDNDLYEDRYNDCVSGNDIACDWNMEDGTYTRGAAGPYSVESIDTTNNIVTVEKNYNYWDKENVWADTIIFQFVQTKAAALSELMADNIDIMDSRYVPLPEDFTGLTGVSFESVDTPAHQEISLNHLQPYFGTGEAIPDSGNITDNREQARLLRTAMSHILNREFIVNEVLDGIATPATTVMPSASIGYDDSLFPHDYNISTARKIMSKIGFNYSQIPGFDIHDPDAICGTKHNPVTCFFNVTLLSHNTGPSRNQWSALYFTELPKIGIGVKEHVSTGWDILIPRTFGWNTNQLNVNHTLVPLYDEGGFDIFFVGYKWDFNWDPSSLYTNSGLCDQGDCGNFYNYINATVENKIYEYLNSYDRGERLQAVKELQTLLYQEVPVIPVIYPMETWAWQADLQGLDPFLIGESQQDWGNIRKEAWEHPAIHHTESTTTTSSLSPSIEANNLSFSTFTVVLVLVISVVAKSVRSKKDTKDISI